MATALEAAGAELRSILQTVPNVMIIIDERGRIDSRSADARIWVEDQPGAGTIDRFALRSAVTGEVARGR